MIVIALLLTASATVAPGNEKAPPGGFSDNGDYTALAERLKSLARCILSRSRSSSIEFVEDGYASAHAKRIEGGIKQAMRGCSTQYPSLSLQVEDLRGDVAEQLLDENGAELLSKAATLESIAPVRLSAADADVTDELFNCAVAAKPRDASSLIQSAPSSLDEMASFRALAPALQACVPLDYAVRLKPHMVRRHIAEALYRRVKKVGL